MLIPSGGFGWVLGDREAAPSGLCECILAIDVATEADVDEAVVRAKSAGADVVTPPARQSWGYTATFADPDGHLWLVSSGPPLS